MSVFMKWFKEFNKLFDSPDAKYFKWFIVIGLVFIGSILVFGYWSSIQFERLEERGQYGDSFGVMTALFSGLSMAGVIVTIWMQRDELRENRKILQDSTDAQEQSKKALQDQLDTMRSTAKIDVLNRFIETRAGTAANSKWVSLSRKIIEKATMDIMRSPEYERMVMPRFQPRNKIQNTLSRNKTYFDNMIIHFDNIGTDMTGLEIRLPEKFTIHPSTAVKDNLPANGLLSIEANEIPFDVYVIEVEFSSVILNKRWHQRIELDWTLIEDPKWEIKTYPLNNDV